MQLTTAALLATGLAAQQASATYNWLDAKGYSIPSTCDNKCSSDQSTGYNWSGLSVGSPVSSYGSNTFSGFSCKNVNSKRDLMSKRTFGSKCISGDLSSSPSIGCGGDSDKFSIGEMHVSTDYDTDVECTYHMPGGSTCKQTHSCSSGGNIIKNSQCGGATSVVFSQPTGSPNKGKGSCSVNIHSVGFECASSTTVSAASATLSVGYSTSVAYSASLSYSSAIVSSASESLSSYSSEILSSASASVSSYASEVTPTASASSYSSEIFSSASASLSSYASEITSSASASISSYAVPTYSTSEASPVESTSSAPASYPSSTGYYGSNSSVVSIPGTSGFASSTPLPSSTEVSPVSSSASSSVVFSSYIPTGYGPSSYVSASANKTVAYSASLSYSSSSSSAGTPVPSAPCPNVVPSCLASWLHKTECKDTSDFDCFCKLADFIPSVMECIESWGGDYTCTAASYLVGICAKEVASNPALITAMPSSCAASTPTASSVVGPVSSSASLESTVYVTDVVKTTLTTCPVGHTLTTAGSTIVLTTPSVIPTSYTTQTTVTAVPTQSASEVAPVSSGPVTSAPGVPTTITLYSTAKYTITSCAADVTNCPARSTVVSSSLVPIGTTVSVASASQSSSMAAPVSSGASVPSSSEAAPVSSGPISSAPAVPQTVTLYSTAKYTITSCAADVTNCPARSTVVSSSLVPVGTTVTVASAPASSEAAPVTASSSSAETTVYVTDITKTTVTTCPVGHTLTTSGTTIVLSTPSVISTTYVAHTTVTAVSTPSATEVAPLSSGPISSAPAAGPSTVTLYSSVVKTVTSCGPEVTNCPARSTVVQTSVYAVGTTLTSVESVPTSSEAGPITTAPATNVETAPATSAAPSTTIEVSQVYTVPATYSTGESMGYTIPSSSETTTIHTTITVPQVQFITSTVTGPNGETTPSVGLGAGTPATVSAATTPAPGVAGPTAASSGFMPGYGATTTLASTWAAGQTPAATTGPLEFTGAGEKIAGSMATIFIGAVAAIFLL